MKDGIHPEYRPVVFKDTSTGYSFLTRSTIKSDKTVEWEDGNSYPLVTLEISSSSHPFYTGQQRMVDTAGRVERFRKRYGQGGAKAAAGSNEPTPAADEPVAPEVESADDEGADVETPATES